MLLKKLFKNPAYAKRLAEIAKKNFGRSKHLVLAHNH